MRFTLFAIILVVVSTVGCTQYRPRPAVPLALYTNQITSNLSGHWLDTYDALPEGTPAEQAAKTEARNRILNGFIWVIDKNYDKFEVNFYSNRAGADIATDVIGIALGSSTIFTASAHAKTILAMAAAAVVGGKASIDSHWYNDQTRDAIVNEMRALRISQLSDIERNMTQPVNAYSLDQGILDIQRYYQAGSVVSALQQIVETASRDAREAKVMRFISQPSIR